MPATEESAESLPPAPLPFAPHAAARRQERLKLPAMYTQVRAKQPGAARYTLSGHLYDVSMTGLRFELDEPLPAGQHLHFRVQLPGEEQATVRLEGSIVRLHDESNEPGPVRMGAQIVKFLWPTDRTILEDYLQARGVSTGGESTMRLAA
ncbi:PilZ domain-containing protein [Phycisphaera mikurensis]|uniref:PilZ domain-containing protein n=1 Tax=Phycisphaera mikurensis (strain NBRC 102666 / KCTC 22515 / FYK2301M01) TaxID=1142394 RepID=I0IGN5_PHYMF|nr:PilZ domain-containing protein [Phycisphaera mikurensis]MBB6442895.1 hypothetical protein [Phycisphaera mikurensis]BAM04423.1 hypothetical protein PSMK_22640 [Phycisphaera mikurensis NBRC 102666]